MKNFIPIKHLLYAQYKRRMEKPRQHVVHESVCAALRLCLYANNGIGGLNLY